MTYRQRYRLARTAAAFLALCTAWSIGYARAADSDRLPPCPTEDSTGCYWDAQTRGNGRGQDVVTP